MFEKGLGRGSCSQALALIPRTAFAVIDSGLYLPYPGGALEFLPAELHELIEEAHGEAAR